MEFRVLGPLEVLHEGEAVKIGPPQQRALFALLLVNAPVTVSVDRIIDELWGETPAARAGHAIQVYVSALRKLLAADPAAARIATESRGYALVIDPASCDSARFESLITQAQAAVAAGDPDARDLLVNALSLWRGPALAGLEEFAFATAEASRLEELRLVALEERIGLDLDLGHHQTAAAELESVVREHPWREAFWAHLMTALYRSGRQADALAAYRRYRDLLDEELGLAPGPKLRELEASILSHAVEKVPRGSSGPRATPGSQSAAVRVPPPLALAAASGPLIGRERELEALLAAWRATQDGALRVRLVTGEAGIGKSRLVAELAQRVLAEEGEVLYGACFDDPRPPYAPFVDAIELDMRDVPEEVSQTRLGDDAEQIARIVPAVADRFGATLPASSDSPEGDQLRLFAAVGGYLRRSARRTLVVIEDLHWAAGATLSLLGHLTRTGRGSILLVVTTRDVAPDFSPALTAFVADLLRQPGVERVSLGGLTRSDVTSLLRATPGPARPDVERTAGRLHEATNGSPLFLRELIRELADDGRAGSPTFSPSLRDHVAARFARLSADDREVLDMAGVLGAEFEAGLVAQALDRPAGLILDVLDRAEGLGIVIGVPSAPGRFAFTHALLREVRYESIPAGRRVHMHRAAGQALRRVGGADAPVADLARHFCAAATLGEADEAFRYARRAGELARERFAFADAAEQFERAERAGALVPALDDAARCELAVQRGEALHRAGDPRYREVLLGAAGIARRLGDSKLLADTALALSEQGWTFSFGQPDEAVLDVAGEALEGLPQNQLASRARLKGMLAAGTHQSDRHADSRRLAGEALALAREAGDPTALGEVLITAHWACFDPTNMEQRLAWAGEARDIGTRCRNPVTLSWALRMLGYDHLELGDLPAALAALHQADSIADELDIPYLRVFRPGQMATFAILRGDLDGAQRELGEMAAFGHRLGIDASAMFGGAGAAILIERGWWEQAVEISTQIVERTRGMTAYRASLAMFHARLGNEAQARRYLREFTDTDFELLPRDGTWAAGMVMLADAATRLADVAAATRMRELLAPVAGGTAWGVFTALWPNHLALAQLCVVLEDHGAAHAHLAAAADMCERRDLPYHRVRVALHRAWAARAAGRASEADELAAAALPAARALEGEGVMREAVLMGLA